MKVYVHYKDLDNSCGDEDCCGLYSPLPAIKVFSSLDKAVNAGYKQEDMVEIEVDVNEFRYLN